jgi:hypothetical protein
VTPEKPSTILSLVTQEAVSKGDIVWQRILPDASLPCAVIGYPNGSGALGFLLTTEEILTYTDFDEVGGLAFETGVIPSQNLAKWFAIHAFDPDDAKLFHSVVDDLCEAISHANGDRSIELAMMSAKLDHWLRFLRTSRKGLSVRRQIGLWGELFVLRKIAEKEGWHRALSWWTGSNHASHDFSFDGFAIEVKTTIARSQTVRISSLEQLDGDDLSALYLLNLKIEKVSKPDGRTLADMVALVRSDLVSGSATDQRDLEVRLIGSGYHDIHMQKYRRQRFNAVSTEIYVVDQVFPRLIRSEVPSGIAEATYSVDLASARANLRAIDEIEDGPRRILEVCTK